MRRNLLALALCLLAANAWGQSAVTQIGPITPNDAVRWNRDHTIEDAGGIAGKNGRGLNPHAITDNNGPGLCYNTGLTTGPHNEFCFGHDSNGNPTITADGFNGAVPGTLQLKIGGVTYPFPGSGSGNVVGPVTSAVGNIAVFNNTTGDGLTNAPTMTTGSGVSPVYGTNITVADQTPMTGAQFSVAMGILHNVGGGSTSGSHVTVEQLLQITSPPAANSILNEYVANRAAVYSLAPSGGVATTLASGAILNATTLTLTASLSGLSVADLPPIRVALNSGEYFGFVTAVAGSVATISPPLTGAAAGGNSVRIYKGAIFAYAADAQISQFGSAGSPYFGIVGQEIDVSIQSGQRAYLKHGLQIVGGGNDTQHADFNECMLCFSNSLNVPWNNIIQVNGVNGFIPTDASTTVFNFLGAATIGNGIDFSSATITNCFLKGPSFQVCSGGNVRIANNSASYGAFNAAGGAGGLLYVDNTNNMRIGDINSVFNGALMLTVGGNTLAAIDTNGGFAVGAPPPASKGVGTIVAGAGIYHKVTTVAALPTCNSAAEGALYAISDGTSVTFDGALTGGGANHTMGYCNGTAWKVR